MGGDNFWILWGGGEDTAVMRDIEIMRGPPVPPTRENPVYLCRSLLEEQIELVLTVCHESKMEEAVSQVAWELGPWELDLNWVVVKVTIEQVSSLTGQPNELSRN